MGSSPERCVCKLLTVIKFVIFDRSIDRCIAEGDPVRRYISDMQACRERTSNAKDKRHHYRVWGVSLAFQTKGGVQTINPRY